MKKVYSLLCTLACGFIVIAQSTQNSSSIMLGESLSGDVTSIRPIAAGYTASFNVMLWANKRFSLETGLDYSVRARKPESYPTGPIIFLMTPDYFLRPYYVDYSGTSHYLSIPVKGMINYGKGKLRFFSGVGFSIDCHFKDVNNYTYYYRTSNGDPYTNKVSEVQVVDPQSRFDYYSGMVFTGMSYELSPNWQLRSTAMLRNRVKNAFFYDANGNNFTTIGLGFSLYYKL